MASAYVYPAATAARPHAPTSVGGQALAWDDNGNLSSGRGRAFVWDSENNPLSITLGDKTTSFGYGPDGGRVKKQAPTPADANCAGAAPQTETLTFADVQRVTKQACVNGAWAATTEWTKNVHDGRGQGFYRRVGRSGDRPRLPQRPNYGTALNLAVPHGRLPHSRRSSTRRSSMESRVALL